MGLITDQIARIWSEMRASARYRWPAIVLAWLLCLLGWFLVLTIPDRYETRAQVYVNSSSILKPLLQGIAVSTDTGNAADVVRRALLARPNLERVATRTGLLQRAH